MYFFLLIISLKHTNSPGNQTFVASLSDGSLMLYSGDVQKRDKLHLWKPKIKNQHGKNLKFRVVDAKSKIDNTFLLLGSNNRLYLSTLNGTFDLIEIKGKYDNGFILSENKICGFYKGIVHLVYLNFTAHEYKIGMNNPMCVHYDEITYVFGQEGFVLLTASKDSTVKMFFVTARAEVATADFERTQMEIKNFAVVDNKHVVSFEDSKYKFKNLEKTSQTLA